MIKFRGFLPLKPLLRKGKISHFEFPDEDPPRFQGQLEISHSVHFPIQVVVQAGFLREDCPCRVHLKQAGI